MDERAIGRSFDRVGVLRGAAHTFDCRVVLVYEVALDELDGQATLSHTTTADNHQLVFPKELGGLLC